MNQNKKNKKMPFLWLAVLLVPTLGLTLGISSGGSEREQLLRSALEPFNSQNVEQIRLLSSDTSYDTVKEEIASIQTAAAGWSICQLAFESYLNNRQLSTAEQTQLKELEKLVEKSSLPRESIIGIRKFTSLIFDPLENGLTLTEVQSYTNPQQCGAVKLPASQNGTIAEALRNSQ